MAPVVKNLPANARDVRDTSLIPGLGRSPGGGHGTLLQCSYLENPIDRCLAEYSPYVCKEADMTESGLACMPMIKKSSPCSTKEETGEYIKGVKINKD